MRLLQFLIDNVALASWNPFKYLIGTNDIDTAQESTWTGGQWQKVFALILLPLVAIFFVLKWLGVFKLIGFGKKVYRKKRRSTSIVTAVKRSLPSAKSAMARKMARLRAMKRKKRSSK